VNNDDASEFHWQTLVDEFTGLRHEVNLQTRAARAQMEQGAEALKQLSETAAALEREREADEGRAEEALRPLLKTLIDVYDAMALARREVSRVQTAVETALNPREMASETSEQSRFMDDKRRAPTKKKPWWQRWTAADTQEVATLRARIADLENNLAHQQKGMSQVRNFLASVITGYTMGLQRIDRALTQQGLEVIDCVGEPFDPECMEVVEVVTEPGRAGTEVLEETRRGYLWNGRLFRHSQVRVARP
jgi:molecular chaperone GrpE